MAGVTLFVMLFGYLPFRTDERTTNSKEHFR